MIGWRGRTLVAGAAAVTPAGMGRRGLAARLRGRSLAPVGQLAEAYGDVAGGEVGAIARTDDVRDLRAKKMMSRAAHLAAVALRQAVTDCGWIELGDVGYYLGVGASGGPMADFHALIGSSVGDDGFSPTRLAEVGLGLCTPLLSFQLMNNFTMAHGAILEGPGGPNGVHFSRGGGTVMALVEGLWALDERDATRVVVGGADTALHPATWSELRRDGFVDRGLRPGEGAGLLGLMASGGGSIVLESVSLAPLADAASLLDLGAVDACVLSFACEAPELRAALPAVPTLDVTASIGESLAATAAIGWVAAVDLVAEGARRVAAISLGVDGQLGVVVVGSAS